MAVIDTRPPAPGEWPASKRAIVLIVDDDPGVLRLLERVVRERGLATRCAGDSEEAWRRLASEPVDVMLVDVNLRGESGLELARSVRERHPDTATVMISGEDDPRVADRALELGAYGYLIKPFKRNEVAIAVANALRRRRLEMERRTHQQTLERVVAQRTSALREALRAVEDYNTRLRAAHEETVRRLSTAVEQRHLETGAHIDRMSHYCAVLARCFGLDAEALRAASRLHDVGKIAVPDTVLLKPGALTAAERAEMQRHAAVGQSILEGSTSPLLELAATIAGCHHERWDGSGYPAGIAGDAIPLAGRIAGVADVFDAVTTPRVYRPAMTVDDALTLMRAERGRHFDPIVLDAFFASLDDILAVRSRFGGEIDG